MGKIKSKSIRKAAKNLKGEGINLSQDFEKNKRILEGLEMSKKLRNQLAGLAAKIKKQELAKTDSK